MATIGYARVSSKDQTLDVQLDKLKKCDKIFKEKQTGTCYERPQLKACLDYVREGDVLVITRLDRLARSTLHLCQISEQLQQQQVELEVLDQHIHTGDATGRLMFNMLGAISQFETEIRAERQREGINNARARGVHLGKAKTLTEMQCAELRRQRQRGVLIKTLMAKYGISKSSVYRYLKENA